MHTNAHVLARLPFGLAGGHVTAWSDFYNFASGNWVTALPSRGPRAYYPNSEVEAYGTMVRP